MDKSMPRSKLFYYLLLLSLLTLAAIFIFSTRSNERGSGNEAAQSTSPASGRPDQISILIENSYLPYIRQIAARYEEQYGIKADIRSTDINSLHDQIEDSILRGGTDLDIILVDTVWTTGFARSGLLEPLRNYVTGSVIDKLVPIAYNQRVISNDLYALPDLYAFPVIMEEKFLYYNESMLRSAGIYAPPATWEELKDMAKYIQDKGLAKYGLIWSWKPGEGLITDYTLLANALGVQAKDANGRWVFNEGGGVQALEFMVNTLRSSGLSDPASLTAGDMSAIETFAEGKTPFLISWAYADPILSRKPGFKMALVPGFQGYQRSSTVTGGGALGITRTSRHKDWAWKFIDLTISMRNEASAKDQIGGLSVWNEQIDQFENEEKYLNRNLMTEQFEYAINRPSMSSYVEWSGVLQDAITSALTGRKSARQALDEAKAEIEKQGIK
ncbi:hypothetical protein PGRAT_27555 [Paenibacillus graminis]|uniref:ABC transporter substrate-binding protein n=2 Tax=Paenibacillus graminis TaxID=189425 RepID=A0A089MAW8_9BACL|nr:hypothetical protein PGRAT_27555 [Paenibacillus graminis]